MITKNTIYIALAAAVLAAAGMIGGSVWSDRTIRRLESDAAEAKQVAARAAQAAAARETEAAEYKQKIAYLERQLAEVQAGSRRQDEQIESKAAVVANARADVERTRRKRPESVDIEVLCRKLAAAGHGCED